MQREGLCLLTTVFGRGEARAAVDRNSPARADFDDKVRGFWLKSSRTKTRFRGF